MLSHFRLLGFRGVVYIEHPQKHYCFIKKVDQKREDKIDLIGELPVVLAVITHSAVESYVLLPVCPIVGNKF